MLYDDMLCGFSSPISLFGRLLALLDKIHHSRLLLNDHTAKHERASNRVTKRNANTVATEGLEFLPCPYSGALTGGIPGYRLCPVPAMSSNGPLSLEFGYCAYLE